MKTFTTWSIIILLLVLTAFTFYAHKTARFKAPNPDTPTSTESGLEADSTPLDALLDDLAYCESRNRPEIKIVDTNGYYSYGMFQFQLATWNYYIEKYDILPEAEVYEYKNLIQDGDFQRHVAKTILTNEPMAYRNWWTCSKIIGLDLWATSYPQA